MTHAASATDLVSGGVTTSGTALSATTIELGHASDTTLARVAAGLISVEGRGLPVILATLDKAGPDNTVTETEVFSVVIPGGMMGTKSLVEIMAFIEWINNSGSNRTFIRRLKVNGSTVAQATSVALGSSAVRRQSSVAQWRFINQGATNVNHVGGYYSVGGGTVASGHGQPTSTLVVHDPHTDGASLAVDTTSDVTISMTIEWSAAHADIEWFNMGGAAVLYR